MPRAADGGRVGADGQGVAAELRGAEDRAEQGGDDRGEDHHPGDAEQLAESQAVLEMRGGGSGGVLAAGGEFGDAECRAKTAQGHDQRRHLAGRHHRALQRAPTRAHGKGDDHADRDREPARGGPAVVDVVLTGGHRRQYQHRADRQVDARGDDHERHADTEHQIDGRVHGDLRDVVRGEELARRRDREERDQRDEDHEGPQLADTGGPSEPRRYRVASVRGRGRFLRRGG